LGSTGRKGIRTPSTYVREFVVWSEPQELHEPSMFEGERGIFLSDGWAVRREARHHWLPRFLGKERLREGSARASPRAARGLRERKKECVRGQVNPKSKKWERKKGQRNTGSLKDGKDACREGESDLLGVGYQRGAEKKKGKGGIRLVPAGQPDIGALTKKGRGRLAWSLRPQSNSQKGREENG